MPSHLVVLDGVVHRVEKVDDAEVANQCQGNACGDVSITSTGNGTNLANHGRRRIIISIRWYAGGCGNPSDVSLNPGQTQHFLNRAYCGPYSANYA
jgi:ribosomal protein S27AE